MVFGWGKKKQKEIPQKSDVSAPQSKEISLSDVPETVSEIQQLRTSQTLSEIKHLRNSTQPLIDELIKIGNLLSKDDLKIDDIDKHLAIIVVRGKKQVIDVIKKDVTHLPELSSIDDVKKLNSSLGQILKKVGDVLGRQTRVIHIFAKKYASQLKDNLEVMNSNHSEIDKLIKNYDSTNLLASEINDGIKQIKSLENSKIEKVKKHSNFIERLNLLDREISKLEKDIVQTKSSDEYKNYLDLKNKLELFNEKKLKIKNNIDSQFTKISRPLGRYEYGSSLEKDQKILLTQLVKNPFDALLPKNKDNVIIILENVRKAISAGSISVKDVEKSLSYITETEEILDEFAKNVSEFLEAQELLTSELKSAYPQNLTSLETDYSKHLSDKEDFTTKSSAIEDDLSEIKTKIPRLISKIESNLRTLSNTKYTVSPSS